MARGVPVVCFLNQHGYERLDQDLINELPIVNTSVDTIFDDLQALIRRPKESIRDLGTASRQFVEKYHQ